MSIISGMKKGILIVLVVNLCCRVTVAQEEGPRRVANPETIAVPAGGKVEFRRFPSPSLGKDGEYSIFLPPSYHREPGRRYPVVYFLHGMWNDHTSWAVERYGGIPAQLEALMTSGRIPECLLVHPNGENSFYTDYLDGSRKYEKMIAVDLIEHVESTYRVRSDRSSRALGGVSMGGYGALKIGLKYPDLYASVAGFSPIVFTGDDPSVHLRNSSSRLAQYLVSALEPVYGMPFDRKHWRENDLVALARSAELDGLGVFFALGTADRYNSQFPLQVGVEALSRVLSERGIPHEYRLYENGPHGWQLVVEHLDEVARFLCRTF